MAEPILQSQIYELFFYLICFNKISGKSAGLSEADLSVLQDWRSAALRGCADGRLCGCQVRRYLRQSQGYTSQWW